MPVDIGANWFPHVLLLPQAWSWRFTALTVPATSEVYSPVVVPSFLQNPAWDPTASLEPAVGHILCGNLYSSPSVTSVRYEWKDPLGTNVWRTIANKVLAAGILNDNQFNSMFQLPALPQFRIVLANSTAVDAIAEGCFTLYTC